MRSWADNDINRRSGHGSKPITNEENRKRGRLVEMADQMDKDEDMNMVPSTQTKQTEGDTVTKTTETFSMTKDMADKRKHFERFQEFQTQRILLLHDWMRMARHTMNKDKHDTQARITADVVVELAPYHVLLATEHPLAHELAVWIQEWTKEQAEYAQTREGDSDSDWWNDALHKGLRLKLEETLDQWRELDG